MNIDIVLLTYNQEKFVQQAIESIISQRVNNDMNVRVLVADDNSSDKTLEIIKSFEKKSPFVFYYLHSDGRLGVQRNYQRAFRECIGEYTLVLEGDDYWCSPNHILYHVSFLENHKECSMSVNGIVLYWQDMALFDRHAVEIHNEVHYINIEQQIMENRIGNHSSVCYRTSILQYMPSFIYGDSFDDALVGIWFAQYGFIALLPEYTTVYRKTSTGLWSGLSKNEQIDLIKNRLSMNDKLLEGKYHQYFEKALSQFDEKVIKRNWASYIPPIFVFIVKLIIPKALLKKIK